MFETLRKSLQTASTLPCRMCRILTTSVPSTTSKQCFEQPAASFLVCSLIFIEYKITFVAKSTGVIFFFYPMINVL